MRKPCGSIGRDRVSRIHRPMETAGVSQFRNVANMLRALADEIETTVPDEIPRYCKNQLRHVSQMRSELLTEMQEHQNSSHPDQTDLEFGFDSYNEQLTAEHEN